ncbi:MAG: Co2+/Mg2+ efflux protein ApaG [Saprospiraceae bacterium]|nr:Co2+/Mg2+ efflux protein ApaG [Saprospiraceae bacterium]
MFFSIHSYFYAVQMQTTNGITVCVETVYLADESNPRADYYAFGYHISIENGSPYTVQLLRRRWLIHDATGRQRVVNGDGVIGVQPIINPGGIHAYSSWCEMPTEIGRMSGVYIMLREQDGVEFEVVIPEFLFITPGKLN